MYKNQIEVLKKIAKEEDIINEYSVQKVILDNIDYKQVTMLHKSTNYGGRKFIQVYHQLGFFVKGDTASTYVNTNISLYDIEVKRQKDLTDLENRLLALGFIDIDNITNYYNKTQKEIQQSYKDIRKKLQEEL